MRRRSQSRSTEVNSRVGVGKSRLRFPYSALFSCDFRRTFDRNRRRRRRCFAFPTLLSTFCSTSAQLSRSQPD